MAREARGLGPLSPFESASRGAGGQAPSRPTRQRARPARVSPPQQVPGWAVGEGGGKTRGSFSAGNDLREKREALNVEGLPAIQSLGDAERVRVGKLGRPRGRRFREPLQIVMNESGRSRPCN